MVETARHRDHPLPARAAPDRTADQHPCVGRLAMAREVVAVAVVELGEVDVFRRHQPAPGLVIDEQAAQARHRRLAQIDEGLEPGQGGRTGAVGLQPVDETDQDRVGQLESVLGMLRQRLGQVGHVHFGILQGRIARRPFPPGADGYDGDADQGHECRGNERQPFVAGVAAAGTQPELLHGRPLPGMSRSSSALYSTMRPHTGPFWTKSPNNWPRLAHDRAANQTLWPAADSTGNVMHCGRRHPASGHPASGH